MSLGGGTFNVVGEKKLPGTYINFVSASRASSLLASRGFVAMPLILDWGEEGEVFKVTNSDFQKNALKIFGYDYSHEKLKGLRDLFLNAETLYAYRLGAGTKASCKYANAKFGGLRGNDLKIVVTALTDGETTTGYIVKTLLGTVEVDSQEVTGETATTNLLKDNEFVKWIADVTLTSETIILTNGANDTITVEDYSEFLDKIEAYSFNILGCVDTSSSVKALFVAFTKRMRDEQGIKFQCVLHKQNTADYEGIISVENNLKNSEAEDASLVYWVTGASAGCAVNKSNTNKIYNGEFDINADYTQSQLSDAIDSGKFIFHKVGDDIRVLEDINTLTTVTDEKNDDFKANQTVRVLDQIANDIANIFNTKYLGVMPNDKSGRISLWNDIVKHHQELENIRAIENFESDKVTVDAGTNKKSVVVYDVVTPVNCMSQLYVQCVVA